MSYNENPNNNQGGYNPDGYNRGYNQGGYNPNGYNQGYNPNGYNNGGMPPKPNNYLVFSILVTLFCCLPTGIAAIIYSSQTDSAYYAGNYDVAIGNSNKAKTWCIVSVVVSVIVNIIVFGFYGAVIFSALHMQ